MSRYGKDVAKLAPLETFDAGAFTGDADWPQETCDVVLALALAYDDLKDTMFAVSLLQDVAPADLATPTSSSGHFAGLHFHLMRLVAARLHAIIELVEKNRSPLQQPIFEHRVRRQLPKKLREAWDSVLAAAEGRPGRSPLAMLLVRVRNKVAFHYDPAEVARGYAQVFVGETARATYISRGSTMAETRFYFADAAAEAYMRNVTDAGTTESFFTAAVPLLPEINHALREVVFRFITARGFAWRRVAG